MKDKYSFFRKGWIQHTIIMLFAFIGAIGFIVFSLSIGGSVGIIMGTCGVMVSGLGGGLMDAILCYEYHMTGEPKV